MSITVRIPSPLRQYTELKSEIVLEGKTVGEVLESFKTSFPDAGIRFFSRLGARCLLPDGPSHATSKGVPRIGH